MSVHDDLRWAARLLPRGLIGPRTLPLFRTAGHLRRPRPLPGVTVLEVSSPRLRCYRPVGLSAPAAALLWLHGGGMVIGTAADDEPFLGGLATELGICIASVDYRLAPENPFPAALDDCYAALRWLHAQSDVDPLRIAIGGASAGGGLAAALAQVAHDGGELPVAFQLLIYPMLDDRSAVTPVPNAHQHRLWTRRNNYFGWRSYLGQEPGTGAVTAPAAPARRADLSGLPPAWIGVGTHDLFHDEDVDYAQRLADAGVACQLEVVPGAFHGFDIVAARAQVSRRFRAAQIAALRAGLALS